MSAGHDSRARGLPERLARSSAKRLRRVLPLGEERGQRRWAVRIGDPPAPEIARHLAMQLGIALQELRREGDAGGERRVGERALAEAVDGEDRGLVEGLARELETRLHVGLRQPGTFERRQQPGREGIGAFRSARLQAVQGLHDPGADPLAELGGGGVGEGDHQDLAGLEALLHQQAEVEPADVPGLARAGGRLDQVDPGERAGEYVQGRRGDHDFSRWSSITASRGPKTVVAQRSKAPSRGLAIPRRAMR